jgi:hypothetical protein
MAQAISRRPLTAEDRVRVWVSPCGIYGGQNGTGRGFSPSRSVLLCQYLSTMSLNAYISSEGWTINLLVTAVQRQSRPSTRATTKNNGLFNNMISTTNVVKRRIRWWWLWKKSIQDSWYSGSEHFKQGNLVPDIYISSEQVGWALEQTVISAEQVGQASEQTVISAEQVGWASEQTVISAEQVGWAPEQTVISAEQVGWAPDQTVISAEQVGWAPDQTVISAEQVGRAPEQTVRTWWRRETNLCSCD